MDKMLHLPKTPDSPVIRTLKKGKRCMEAAVEGTLEPQCDVQVDVSRNRVVVTMNPDASDEP